MYFSQSEILGDELNGTWRVQWPKGSQADYSITTKDSMVTVLGCNWNNCKQEKTGKLSSSNNSEYSYGNGWLKVENLHKQNLDIYMKRVGERLILRWKSRVGKRMFTGQGTRSKYCFLCVSSRGVIISDLHRLKSYTSELM